ncbi:hypothetical protein, unlikely [Trypanosoma congolense IL3000]|uniref:Uncharacterized protein n=1 Tax=Trypanosoma congolense (strain IL3000) TaxID=1068625 RepID=F9W8M0_TRYCI|nr:hypothetical protein, unlikely [Trypanosoma congolense IL3000]
MPLLLIRQVPNIALKILLIFSRQRLLHTLLKRCPLCKDVARHRAHHASTLAYRFPVICEIDILQFNLVLRQLPVHPSRKHGHEHGILIAAHVNRNCLLRPQCFKSL